MKTASKTLEGEEAFLCCVAGGVPFEVRSENTPDGVKVIAETTVPCAAVRGKNGEVAVFLAAPTTQRAEY